jgi:tRNA A37 threonylcarbamoyladenosine synthetase subunit TsaC/SUA5/YrdC
MGIHGKQEKAKRLTAAVAQMDDVKAWCESRYLKFTLFFGERHWQFQQKNRIVEWWPGTGTVIVQKDYHNALYADDWERCRTLLEGIMAKVPQ